MVSLLIQSVNWHWWSAPVLDLEIPATDPFFQLFSLIIFRKPKHKSQTSTNDQTPKSKTDGVTARHTISG